jgi:succinoglycan biosynthesis transport protein ExoP
MPQDARTLMCEQLKSVGFSEVTMLGKPVTGDVPELGPRVAA